MHYFFSDVHLGLGSRESNREREHLLLRFFDMIADRQAESLYIVGDLFDYWFDYRSVIPREFVRTLAGLAALVDAGIRVDYIIGNHDFGHYTFFRDELGVALHQGDLERTIAGRRCYIAHGDGKAFRDTGYKILKSVLRARVSNALFRLIHPDIGIGIASYASRKSRQHTSEKNYDGGERPGERDGLQAFAEEKLRGDTDLVIMGHSHRPCLLDLPGGTYANLGTWLGNRRTYLVVGEEGVIMKGM